MTAQVGPVQVGQRSRDPSGGGGCQSNMSGLSEKPTPNTLLPSSPPLPQPTPPSQPHHVTQPAWASGTAPGTQRRSKLTHRATESLTLASSLLLSVEEFGMKPCTQSIPKESRIK